MPTEPTAYSLVPTDALTVLADHVRWEADRAAEIAGCLYSQDHWKVELRTLADHIRSGAAEIDALIAADKTNSPL